MQSTIITTDQPQETISRPALTQREKHTLNECMERVSKTSNNFEPTIIDTDRKVG